jgi:hypothetical protein
MAANTIVVSPAAGPLMLSGDLLKAPTIAPPMIPDNSPENKGAPDAKAIPRHRGNATRNTTTPERKSFEKYFLMFINVK